jgi:hypothetical protein
LQFLFLCSDVPTEPCHVNSDTSAATSSAVYEQQNPEKDESADVCACTYEAVQVNNADEHIYEAKS